MLPRALLFSSDEQTSTVLRQVLTDLRVELVHCREIFAAIEELTTRSFQLILIDWGQELEASFLLNMSRELKSTKSTYSVVIVNAGLARALTVRPDGFLEKPFSREEAQDAVVGSPCLRQLVNSDEYTSPVAPPAGFETPTESIQVTLSSLTDSKCLHSESVQLEASSLLAANRTTREKTGQRSRFFRPEQSVGKKAAALVCLLTLLVAVVHGEEQLGYLPDGLLSYRNLSELLSSPRTQGPQAGNPFAPDPDPIAEFHVADIDNQGKDNYFIDLSRRTTVHLGVRQPYSTQSKSASAASELIAVGSNAVPSEAVLPTGANPLIPSSLYISPQRLSSLPGSLRPILAPTNWKAGVIAVTEETSRSLLIHQVSPNYPLEALRAGLQGPVVFEALVGRDGTVQDLKLVRGYFALGLAAVDSVKQWRFRPYRVNGEIVQMQTFLTVSFPTSNEGKPNSNGSLMTYGAWR